MKKSTVFFLIIALLCLGTGGVGSIYYYQQSQNLIKKSSYETYTNKDLKNQENLVVKVTGGTAITIEPSDDEEFHLEQLSYFRDNHVTWKINEGDGTTTIALAYQASAKPK